MTDRDRSGDVTAAVRGVIDAFFERLPPEMREPTAIGVAVAVVLGTILVWLLRVRHEHLKNKELETRIRSLSSNPDPEDARRVSKALNQHAFPERIAEMLAHILAQQAGQRSGPAGPGSGPATPTDLPLTFVGMARSQNADDRRALGYLVEGKDQAALSELKKSAEQEQNLESWRRVAQVAYARNTDAAIEAYERIDGLKPDDLETTLALSRLYSRKGQSDKALAAAKKAYELAKDNPVDSVSALVELSAAQRRTGRVTESKESADRAVHFARTD